jgi:hypothetical protein
VDYRRGGICIKILLLLRRIANEPARENVTVYLPTLLQLILKIFSAIKQCKNIYEAQSHFDVLDKIQFSLATLVFKEKVGVSNELRKFIRDCDRLDDTDVRKFLFDGIKNGTYSLSGEGFLWYS